MAEQPHKVFISYSRDLEDVARRLAGTLRAQGVTPWLDAEQLAPGQSSAEAIREGIKTSDAIAVLVGGTSSPISRFEQSEIVKHGWEDANARVLPVIVGDAELPGFLRDHEPARVDPETHDGMDQVAYLLRTSGGEDFITRTPDGTARLTERLSDLDAQAAALNDET
jgi:hypothetical protein